MTTPCCPPNSDGFLAPSYSTNGTVEVLSDGFLYYAAGTSPENKPAVIILSSIWGWNGGRTRNVADFLASAGYFVAIPQLLVPPLRGGTDGDGLPPDFDMINGRPEAMEFMTSITWAGVVRPRVASLIAFLKAAGAKNISLAGFCWGAWAGAHIASEFSSDIASAVFPHPSITHEETGHGGDAVMLVGSITKPVLFMPAGNDPDRYRPGGDLLAAIKSSSPESDVLDFPEMKHGWSLRDSLQTLVSCFFSTPFPLPEYTIFCFHTDAIQLDWSFRLLSRCYYCLLSTGDLEDPATKRDVDLALEKLLAFIGKYST